MEGAIAAAGLKMATPIISAAIGSTLTALKSVPNQITEKVSRDLRVGFSDFLVASYNRCQQVKTLVSGDQPIPLLEIYVNLKLNCDDTPIDDIDLIHNLEDFRRVVITGTGGAGKSMFMKFLTLARFETTKGKIPLFVELRNLNSLTTKDVLQYCFSSCSTAKNKISYSSFEKVLSAGGFILILDGFDEIDLEFRDDIERQILEMSRKFPEAILVVSSRNDARFKSWQSFFTYEVRKLDQKQAESLISKVRCESGIKRRFIRDIPSLWSTHESFLSVPLLAVIMLITFGKFSEISPKTTLFYKLAFQTLFREHDASKEQFKRPLNTTFDLDDFEKCFSAFCAISYADSKISFSSSEAKAFAEKAIQYARLDGDPDGFIKDLICNICMLQEEGTEITFAHRSFQEYFTAVFTVGYHEKNLAELVDEIAGRDSDSTLLMLKELDVSKFEAEWLVGKLDELCASLGVALKDNDAHDAITWLFTHAFFTRELNLTGMLVFEKGRSGTIRNLGKLYPKYGPLFSIGEVFSSFHTRNLLKIISDLNLPKSAPINKFISNMSRSDASERQYKFGLGDAVWLKEIGILEIMGNILKGLRGLKEEINLNRAKQGNILRL